MNIKEWLVSKISEETGLKSEDIDCDKIFEEFDMDSLSSISITFDMEKNFELDEINPSVFSEFNTINKLSNWVEKIK